MNQTSYDIALGKDLLDKGLIDDQRLEHARRHAQRAQTGLGISLSSLGYISDDILATRLATSLNTRLISLLDIKALKPEIEGLSLSYLKAQRLLPVLSDEGLHLAITNLEAMTAVHNIEKVRQKSLPLLVATPDTLELAFQHFFPTEDDTVRALTAQGVQGIAIDDAQEDDLNAPVIRYVNKLIARALKAGASDIHLEPFENRLIIRLRKDGILTPAEEPPSSIAPELASRIKLMANLDIAEKRLPQDGRIRRIVRGQAIELRISTLSGLYGESIVMRLLDGVQKNASLETLGFAPADMAQLYNMTTKPSGIMLVCGPTGSGKTTSLYACLEHINDGRRKIITAEDPVEYQMEGVIQTHVQPKLGLDFARVLRAALRQDPDVIMVGEIRDLETAEVAIQASLTGHMVLSTLHTNSAVATLTRLMDLGIEPYLIASSLNGIIAQRLVRKLCPDCKSPCPPTQAHIDWLGPTAKEISLYQPSGCETCQHTGYHGRTVLYEILECTSALRAAIAASAPEHHLDELAIRAGLTPLIEAGKSLVRQGLTSMDEILRVTMESRK